jgi:hypothetical protein
MPIIVDYSASSISSILAFSDELRRNDKLEDLIRHVILSTLQSYRKKYYEKYGELIIACDGSNYWRKEFFPYYKGSRKKNRDKSDLPWHEIFSIINKVRQELIETFPYKVIQVERAEGDDVIAVLTEYFQTNELIQIGIVEDSQPIMIISSDGDYLQLQKYSNVDQWSPMTKKLMTAPHNYMQTDHIEHIVRGDSGDGVPNIRSDDTVLITDGVRQKSITKLRLEEFIENGIDACKDDMERRNWHRNQQMIDFDFIPSDIKEKIIESYQESKPSRNRQKILDYLIKNRCRNLMNTIEDF